MLLGTTNSGAYLEFGIVNLKYRPPEIEFPDCLYLPLSMQAIVTIEDGSDSNRLCWLVANAIVWLAANFVPPDNNVDTFSTVGVWGEVLVHKRIVHSLSEPELTPGCRTANHPWLRPIAFVIGWGLENRGDGWRLKKHFLSAARKGRLASMDKWLGCCRDRESFILKR